MRLQKLSDDFINKLAGISAGLLQESDFEKLLILIESEISKHYFTHSSESNLLRIINGMFDKFFFLNECVKYPHYVEILVSIASNTNYLSDILVIHPEYFYVIVNPSRLNTKLDQKIFAKETEEIVCRYNSLNAKTHALNTLKKREILRIGLKDIYSHSALDEIVEELSILAQTLTSQLFSECYKYILQKYKIGKINRSYCIISLGKLGGRELNYSSDTDLIIFYDKETKIGNGYYSEILSETIQLFLDKCSSSEAGSLYRIDLRLRPDGKSSSVCRSLQEYLDYYESRGSDWERQMLIKAGFLGGNEKLYLRFKDYMDSFIYPATHFISPLEQMKKLKQIIERDNETTENIKLIPGGIRDIEFIVQALQLLNGGTNESVKTGNTLTALQKLLTANLLSLSEEKTLRQAYILYRKVEHFLQLMNNAQTHTIPDGGEIAEKLSVYLGYKDLKRFKAGIDESRKKVREIYNSIIGEKKSDDSDRELFDQVRFDNSQRASNDIAFLREGKGLTISRKFDKKSLEAFSKIENNVYSYLKSASDPDLCLSNFVRVIKQADFPSIWYNELQDKEFLKIFLNTCENSQMVIDLFAEDKILRERFISRDFLNDPRYEDIASSRMKNLLFRLGMQLSLLMIKPEEASKILSLAVIERINSLAEDFSSKKKWKNDFFIIVLGSTGMQTMSFASDIDLIFAVKTSKKYETIQKEFQELLGILKKELIPFTVDCRLRPEGESSQLVWDFKKYTEYLFNRARIWELQSFLKSRFVCGNEKLFENLTESFGKRISQLAKEELLNGITEIRSKSVSNFPSELDLIDLKRNPGGLSDIEYITHYLLLSKRKIAESIIDNSIPTLLKDIEGNKKVLNELSDNYVFLKEIEIFNQLAFSITSSKITDDEQRFEKLAKVMSFKDGFALKSKLNAVLKSNRELYSEIILKNPK